MKKEEEEPLLPLRGDLWSVAGKGICGQVVPKVEAGMKAHYEDSVPQCIREDGHKDEHLIVNQAGKFFVWQYDEGYCCDDLEECDCYREGGLIECYSWGEVKKLQLVVDFLRHAPYLIQPLLAETKRRPE